ncbi:NADH dehydrogenase [endosymbiont of Acanthamoeba sp. UWC8]|uniref:NAD(P)/FAD-dependent oxidoreductase n=1 Tax=endosymbiont of Acanthamoeba sp. UWC8 TaxID=86106 RepID=UPI0004D141F2|nr:NAD(P)/FAD-dependent oxidoreductase [endosymbiont of Acanthamoeba sp. UWC8]AIF81887.1 NADH dehydrogenase [endosymbiont of Acanthamoeba sp. UWC8]
MAMQGEFSHIVIVGGGFAGLTAAQNLKKQKNIKITIIDVNNYHVFQPFLYQVACGDLAPSDIAVPIREQFKDYRNISVIMDEVTVIDSNKKIVFTKNATALNYDYLILAVGSEDNYFGNEHWREHTIGLKSLKNALKIRKELLETFERAEIANHKKHVTFTIIGGGPTGVELAGAIAELTKQAIRSDFTHINPLDTEIILIEAGSRILSSLDSSLSAIAQKSLEEKGIVIKLNSKVMDISSHKIKLSGGEEIESDLIIWAAGVKAKSIKHLLNKDEIKLGTNQRVLVNNDLSLPLSSNIFIVGDAAEIKGKDNKAVPALAAAATQQGKFIAKVIRARIAGSEKEYKFKYLNFGNMAIIGRYSAVADFTWIKFKGVLAWIIWDLAHIYFLIGFRNRLTVFVKWLWSYVTHGKAERIIIK